MFYFRKEGEKLRNGFNLYRLSDTHSAGFVFRIGTKSFMFRYGKKSKIWFIG